MKTPVKVFIVAALVGAVAAVLVLKQNQAAGGSATSNPTVAVSNVAAVVPTPVAVVPLPKLLDLGANKCIPCKAMAPILEELKKEYAGRMDVVFIDVWQVPDAGKQFGVEMIPTQIFFDADGKELFRHTGFFSKEDILAKWKELGVELK
jgi:thioredoxin 1